MRCCTTSSASITSAASKPTGPSPPTKKPPSTAHGSKRPALALFRAPRATRSARCRWSPKTSASSPQKSTLCALELEHARHARPPIRLRRPAARTFTCRTASSPDTVAYTGTHDNDTTHGWWQTLPATAERTAVEAYLGPVAEAPVWPLIRAAESSVAELAIVPAQDLLDLGSEARMNTPAVAQGNWSWRVPEAAFTPALAARLAAIADVTDRDTDPLAPPRTDPAS